MNLSYLEDLYYVVCMISGPPLLAYNKHCMIQRAPGGGIRVPWTLFLFLKVLAGKEANWKSQMLSPVQKNGNAIKYIK